jgi:hypothetical protein
MEDFEDSVETSADEGSLEFDPEPQAEAAPKKSAAKSKDKGNDEVAAMRRELQEQRDAARYWAEQARRTTPAQQQPATKKRKIDEDIEIEDDGDDDDDGAEETESVDDFVASLAADGHNALAKRGYLKAKQIKALINDLVEKKATKIARAVVGREREALNRDAALTREFPGLSDEKSEMFQRTSEVYREMIAEDPSLGKSPSALKAAARVAAAELAKSGTKKRSRVVEDDEDEEAELTREERIAMQAGGQRRNKRQSEDSDELSPLQKKMVREFGISEADYRKAAKNLQVNSRSIQSTQEDW